MRRLSIAIIVFSFGVFGFVIGGVVAIELMASSLVNAGSSSSDLFATDSLGREWQILLGCATGGLAFAGWAVLVTRRYARPS